MRRTKLNLRMILNVPPRSRRTYSILILFIAALFLSKAANGQAYISEVEAIQVLNDNLKQLDQASQSALAFGNSDESLLIAYKYQYVTKMLDMLNNGYKVSHAIDSGLPSEQIRVFVGEEQDEISDSIDVDEMNLHLKAWAAEVLTN